jgi:hypothetical protein
VTVLRRDSRRTEGRPARRGAPRADGGGAAWAREPVRDFESCRHPAREGGAAPCRHDPRHVPARARGRRRS